MALEKTAEKAANMAKDAYAEAKSNYPEVKRIQEDVNSLKGNVRDLARHVYADGTDALSESGTVAREQFSRLGELSQEQLKVLESRIKSRPGQSILIAFAAGLLTSLFFGRK